MLAVTGVRVNVFTHSRLRKVHLLRKHMPEPELEINARTAKALGIRNGDRVRVESAQGSLELKARLTADIHPKVVAMQHGWSESNANLLTDDELRDPLSGYPAYRAVPCQVRKVS